MKTIYRVLAEIVFLIHVGLILLMCMIPFWWDDLFFVYTVIIILGLVSWVVARRCVLSELEHLLRDLSGQQRTATERSFIGYWAGKILGGNSPSDEFIARWVGGFYVLIAPWWMYLVYLHYTTW